MSGNNILETVGTITKKEILSSIEHDTCNAMVLETLKPYPGYHGTTIPDHLNPMSLFLVTGKKYTGESVVRATMSVKRHSSLSFDAVPGQITVFNNLTPCIRIKDLKGYESIAELVTLYKQYGIEFMKARKMEPFYGLIKIRKYFKLEQIEKNLYRDLETPAMAYFEIPEVLTWEVFESITHNMKLNVDFNNFDAALGVFFTPAGVIDNVRIYHEEIDLDEVRYLRSKYLEEIARLP
ncbi:MAG: hypothetical protein ACLFPE_06295 [Bacteroidales bacterium]